MTVSTEKKAFVIGMGEVGTRLSGALRSSGWEIGEVTRTDGWEAASGPSRALRIVCVREGALVGVLERLERVDRELIVLVQNGWVRDVPGVEGCGRGLIWFTSKGDFYRVLRPSPFSGAHAQALAAVIAAGGIDATAVSDDELRPLEAEKMGFNCVVGLPLAVHGVDLGTYLDRHGDEAEQVFTEAVEVGAAALGVAASPDWYPRFVASVEPLGWVSASRAKALEWRNGAVVRLARRLGRPADANERLLDAVDALATAEEGAER